MPKNYMLDTCILSNLLQGRVRRADIPARQLWATPVQAAELAKTKSDAIRERLLSMFKEVIANNGSNIAPAFAFDVDGAGWGQGEFRNGEFGQKLLKELNDAWETRSRREKKKSKKENNLQDASIAEAAKFHNYTLLTCDEELATVAERNGVKVTLLRLGARHER
jgi:predicted nucleic acid-binding protein